MCVSVCVSRLVGVCVWRGGVVKEGLSTYDKNTAIELSSGFCACGACCLPPSPTPSALAYELAQYGGDGGGSGRCQPGFKGCGD